MNYIFLPDGNFVAPSTAFLETQTILNRTQFQKFGDTNTTYRIDVSRSWESREFVVPSADVSQRRQVLVFRLY